MRRCMSGLPLDFTLLIARFGRYGSFIVTSVHFIQRPERNSSRRRRQLLLFLAVLHALRYRIRRCDRGVPVNMSLSRFLEYRLSNHIHSPLRRLPPPQRKNSSLLPGPMQDSVDDYSIEHHLNFPKHLRPLKRIP